MKKLNPIVFWPPFILLVGAIILNFLNEDLFAKIMTTANSWLIQNLGWAFSVCGLFMVGLIIVIYVSPFGRIKIGGPDAEPLLNNWQWFSITLCTTVAVGILFWATAEPIYHMTSPPVSLGIKPGSPEAAVFAMSTLYLHWTFTPYAIYAIPGLMFAFAYYNMKKPFSIGSAILPVVGRKNVKIFGNWIDALCMYTLSAGMAASLATGILTIAGGIHSFTGIVSNPITWTCVGAAIIITFIISASTGLMQGIRILSDINTKVFFIIIIFIFIFGPTAFLLNIGTECFGVYLTNFFQKSLFTGTASGDKWPESWTMFYWANWLAWTPITALFLGRISYGHTIKEFIRINFWLPALFSGFWITVFSGTAVKMQMDTGVLAKVLTEEGPEAVGFTIFENLPLAFIIVPFFVFISFMAFVTSADSNTSAMGGLSSTGISPESPEPSAIIKITWGIIIGSVALIMLNFAGIDGIKMLSVLGGLPGMVLEFLIGFSILRILMNPAKFDKFEKGYDKHGIPVYTDKKPDKSEE